MGLIILGIDPSTVNTGYGVISLKGSQVECLDYGVISPPPKQDLSKRILYIHNGLKHIFDKYKPHHTAVERVFLGKNPQAAFKIGHIFALCILESETHGSQFFEYASRFVKKNTTFSGNASKVLVQQFMMNKFKLKEKKQLDATDALAVALCHSRYCRDLENGNSSLEKLAKVK